MAKAKMTERYLAELIYEAWIHCMKLHPHSFRNNEVSFEQLSGNRQEEYRYIARAVLAAMDERRGK